MSGPLDRFQSLSLAAAFLPAVTAAERARRWMWQSAPRLSTFMQLGDEPSGLIVCRFPGDVNEPLLASAGLQVVHASPLIPGLVYCRAVVTPLASNARLRLEAETKYLYADKLHPVQTYSTTKGVEQLDQWHHKQIGTDTAWASSHRGKGVTVATIDSYFDLGVPHLTGRVVGGAYWDTKKSGFIADTSSFPSAATDDHGTLCAALAVGENIQGYGRGVAPAAGLVPFAIGDATAHNSQSRLALAIGMAIDPPKYKLTAPAAKVISCSVAPGVDEATGAVPIQTDLSEHLDEAAKRNVLVVWAVANKPVTALVTADQPACHHAVLNVGAVNKGLRFGGAKIPAIVAPIAGSQAVGAGGRPLGLKNENSYAAPIVAGIAALILAKNSNLSAAEVRTLLTDVMLSSKTAILDPTGTYQDVPVANAATSVANA